MSCHKKQYLKKTDLSLYLNGTSCVQAKKVVRLLFLETRKWTMTKVSGCISTPNCPTPSTAPTSLARPWSSTTLSHWRWVCLHSWPILLSVPKSAAPTHGHQLHCHAKGGFVCIPRRFCSQLNQSAAPTHDHQHPASLKEDRLLAFLALPLLCSARSTA